MDASKDRILPVGEFVDAIWAPIAAVGLAAREATQAHRAAGKEVLAEKKSIEERIEEFDSDERQLAEACVRKQEAFVQSRRAYADGLTAMEGAMVAALADALKQVRVELLLSQAYVFKSHYHASPAHLTCNR